MSKLGALLLKGLRSNRKHSRSAPSLFASRTQRKKVKSQPKATFSRATPITRNPVRAVAKTKEFNRAVAPVDSASTVGSELFISQLVKPNGIFRASIEAFLLDQRSEHTKRAYSKDLKRFIQFLMVKKIDENLRLNRSVIIAYKDYLLSEKLEHTTIDRHLASLRSFFKWLVEDEVIAKNPAENVRFLNPKKVSATIGFSDEEVIKILSLPDLFTKTGSMHYAILMILFFCGLRRSELCNLRTTDIGVERDQHFLRLKGKGNVERIVALMPPVWKAIQQHLKIARKDLLVDEPLFTPVRNNRTLIRNKPLDPSMIFYIVTRYAKLAGIKNRVSPHSCRATAISNARDHDVPDRAIQEFAGWATTNMITRYDKRKTALEKSAAHAIHYEGEPSSKIDKSLTLNPLIKK